MFEKFQELTPLQRSLIVLVPLAIVIALFAFLLSRGDSDEVAPGATPEPTDTYVAPSDEPSEEPTVAPSPYALNTPPPGTKDGQDTAENSKAYTEKQKLAAKQAAYTTMVDFCRYTAKESREDRLKRLKTYYVPGKFNLALGDMNQLIKAQQCSVFAYELTGNITDDNAIEVGGAAQQATIYKDGTPLVPSRGEDGGALGYTKNVGITLDMKLVKGKWLAEDIKVTGD